jgi:hypothetical protein
MQEGDFNQSSLSQLTETAPFVLTWLNHALASCSFPCSFFALRWPGRCVRHPGIQNALRDLDRRQTPHHQTESRRRRAGRACVHYVCSVRNRSLRMRPQRPGRARVRSEPGKRTCACVQTARASGSSVDRRHRTRARPRQFGRRRWRRGRARHAWGRGHGAVIWRHTRVKPNRPASPAPPAAGRARSVTRDGSGFAVEPATSARARHSIHGSAARGLARLVWNFISARERC